MNFVNFSYQYQIKFYFKHISTPSTNGQILVLHFYISLTVYFSAGHPEKTVFNYQKMQGLWNLIGKGQGPGRDFNYEVGEAMHGYDGKAVWTIHNGKNKVY